jgi:hypothetical protein
MLCGSTAWPTPRFNNVRTEENVCRFVGIEPAAEEEDLGSALYYRMKTIKLSLRIANRGK